MRYPFEFEGDILLTGGSGTLGSVIQKLIHCIVSSSRELDIRDAKQCENAVKKYNPDIIIHCAAYTDVANAETEKKKCWEVNVMGTENMVRAARGRRFVYISTSYVFDGRKGDYREDDTPNPINFYALTKLAGELIVRQYPRTLIIRTMFKKYGPWPYERAFIDQWTTAEFAPDIAPDIVRAALMPHLLDVIHISGTKKTIYELAKGVSPTVGKMSIQEVPTPLPADVSLDNSLWEKISSKLKPVKK